MGRSAAENVRTRRKSDLTWQAATAAVTAVHYDSGIDKYQTAPREPSPIALLVQ